MSTSSYGALNGFVPYLFVWDSAGTYLSGDLPSLDDAEYIVPLTAGDYFAALTVANNMATDDLPSSTPDPSVFSRNGQGNFTYSEFSCLGSGPQGPFYDAACNPNTGNWAMNITGATLTTADLWPASGGSVPAPSALALVLGGMVLTAAGRRRRRAAAAA